MQRAIVGHDRGDLGQHGLRGGGEITVVIHDVPAATEWHPGERAFFVALRFTGSSEIQSYWDKLCEGAQIMQPLGPSAWSPVYGMLTDRFGTTWVMDVAV